MWIKIKIKIIKIRIIIRISKNTIKIEKINHNNRALICHLCYKTVKWRWRMNNIIMIMIMMKISKWELKMVMKISKWELKIGISYQN